MFDLAARSFHSSSSSQNIQGEMEFGRSLVVRSRNDPSHRFTPYQRVPSQHRVVSYPSPVRVFKVEPQAISESEHDFYYEPPRPQDGFPQIQWGHHTRGGDAFVVDPSAKSGWQPSPWSHCAFSTGFQDEREVKKAAVTETNEKLREVRRLLQCADESDQGRIAHLRKEHDELLKEILQLDRQYGASKEFNELQSEADVKAMTQPSFLRKLKTLLEVERILSYINVRLRWVAHRNQDETRRMTVYRQKAREYRSALAWQNSRGHRPSFDIIPSVQTGMDRERPLGALDNTARVVGEKSVPHAASQDRIDTMVHLISEVTTLTRKVNDIQRAVDSGEKSDATKGLGIALRVTVQELLDRTNSLTGSSVHHAAGKEVDVEQVPVTEAYACP
ncbi:MAG: hypothetical protein Q9216_006887 [Gyalolechia sp. 2 TL-2023]